MLVMFLIFIAYQQLQVLYYTLEFYMPFPQKLILLWAVV